MNLSRRELMLMPALALKANAAPAGRGEARNKQEGMAYRRLGRTNFLISEVVMGGNTISPTNYDHVLRALDMGLNYLDTAPAYGNLKSELGYAQVLKARPRDQFFLNSKISCGTSTATRSTSSQRSRSESMYLRCRSATYSRDVSRLWL